MHATASFRSRRERQSPRADRSQRSQTRWRATAAGAKLRHERRIFMFWAVMLIVLVVLICVSFLVGISLKQRDKRQLTRQEMMTMTKASGALKHRKSNR
jgi:type VI protein secretion system component VasF